MTGVSSVNGAGYVAPQKKSGVVSGTIKAGLIGAGVAGTMNALCQRAILKDPQAYIKDIVTKRADLAKEVKELLKTDGVNKSSVKNFVHFVNKLTKNARKVGEEFAKTGKFNWTRLAKRAGIGAAVVGGVYLAYRGVKALFSSNDKAA